MCHPRPLLLIFFIITSIYDQITTNNCENSSKVDTGDRIHTLKHFILGATIPTYSFVTLKDY